MKHAIHKQSGLTFISFLFVMAIIVVTVLFILRLFPLYNEKFQIESAMQTVVSQPDAAHKSVAETRRAFLRALTITNITRFNDRNIRQHVNLIRPKASGEPPMLHVRYQATNRLFGDLQLLLTFDKQIPITSTAGAGGN